MCVYICTCSRAFMLVHKEYVWRSEDNLQKLDLSIYDVGLRNSGGQAWWPLPISLAFCFIFMRQGLSQNMTPTISSRLASQRAPRNHLFLINRDMWLCLAFIWMFEILTQQTFLPTEASPKARDFYFDWFFMRVMKQDCDRMKFIFAKILRAISDRGRNRMEW